MQVGKMVVKFDHLFFHYHKLLARERQKIVFQVKRGPQIPRLGRTWVHAKIIHVGVSGVTKPHLPNFFGPLSERHLM